MPTAQALPTRQVVVWSARRRASATSEPAAEVTVAAPRSLPLRASSPASSTSATSTGSVSPLEQVAMSSLIRKHRPRKYAS